jgi:transposase
MRTVSLDLRERILLSYDNDEGTREEIAVRYRVSLGMVKKLLQQRRRTGEIGALHHRSGRKPRILESHQRIMRQLLAGKPDMTLLELRAAVSLNCTLPAIHYALAKMGLTYKKRVCMPVSKIGRMSNARAKGGVVGRVDSIRPDSSSSTSRRQKRT